jgi:hypothetical protein
VALLAKRGIGWPDAGGIESKVRTGLWRLESKDGGLTVGDFAGRVPVPQARPVWPAEVEHLAAAAPMPHYPGNFEGDMQRVALNAFKARHPEAEGESEIALVRLGADEGGAKRMVNVTAKHPLGYSEADISRLVRESSGSLIEDEAF